MMNVLACDIGGTKTILAIYPPGTRPRQPLAEITFPSSHYESLEAIIKEFLDKVNLPVDRACFGVAGPVLAGRAKITNLSWMVDGPAIRSTFNWSAVALLNDLESVAYAIPVLEPEDIHSLSVGVPVPGGGIAVLAPGTGLGEAFLISENGTYRAHASEGSHASFAPMSSLQIGLLTYLNQQGFDHVSFERVCSGGLGMPHLYAYLKTIGLEEPVWLAEQLATCGDPTPVIVSAAHDQTRHCELAKATLDLFVAILGAEAGNLALKVLSTGGIYLGGGISPRILEDLEKPLFMEALRSKGRFRKLLTDMPVHVILNSKAALLGAAAFGLTLPAS
jgi:glucokinase